jgi:hypothetical protein
MFTSLNIYLTNGHILKRNVFVLGITNLKCMLIQKVSIEQVSTHEENKEIIENRCL